MDVEVLAADVLAVTDADALGLVNDACWLVVRACWMGDDEGIVDKEAIVD
jgi:hypothetical protein